MFRMLGTALSRGWPVVLILWFGGLGTLLWFAPKWEEVELDREFAYLPADTPSRQGDALFKEMFPHQYYPSTLALVVHRSDGKLASDDFKFIEENLTPGLHQIANAEGGLAKTPEESDNYGGKKSIIGGIHTFKEPGAGALLVSEDRKATLVVLQLTTELLQHRNWKTLKKVDNLVAQLRKDSKVPSGLHVDVAGSAAVGRDVTMGQMVSARATQIWTIVFVVVLLLLLYRAPVLALIPLVTVFVAVESALHLLALLAQAGWITIFEGMQVYITIILYGTGIDYCLFLIARYREEHEHEQDIAEALANSVSKVGVALTASAATVGFSIGMMTFARFGEFHHAGIAITICMAVGWLGALTLTPALLRLAGRFTFGWQRQTDVEPAANGEGPEKISFFSWNHLARVLERWPGAILLTSIVLMTPSAVYAFINRDNLEFDLIKRLPDDAPSIAGTKALGEHFPRGITGPVIVLIRQQGYNFATDQGQDAVQQLTDRLERRRTELGLADIRTLARPFGTSAAAQDALDAMAQQQDSSQGKDADADPGQKALQFYVSHSDVTQLQLVLNEDPLIRRSLDLMDRLEGAIRRELPSDIKNAHIYFLNLTSGIHDLRTVTDADQTRIELLVVGCVLLILLVLLRRPLVAFFLIASVLLSNFCALGATFAFFWALDPAGFTGLDWKTPIFLFVILMAIGADYNIFLLTRVNEEQEHQEPIPAVSSALVKTGRIITSCGIIMAGTFASLLTASLVDLKQLGFALVFGVMLDTFMVRPVMVPAFLILLERSRQTVGLPRHCLKRAWAKAGFLQLPKTSESSRQETRK